MINSFVINPSVFNEDNIKLFGGLYQIEAGDEYLQDFRNAVKALEDVIGLKHEFDYLFLGPYENRNSENEQSIPWDG